MIVLASDDICSLHSMESSCVSAAKQDDRLGDMMLQYATLVKLYSSYAQNLGMPVSHISHSLLPRQ